MTTTFLLIAASGSALLAAVVVAPQAWGQHSRGLHTPVSVIEADPRHNGTLIAGTATARLFRSRDGGDTWSPLFFPADSRATLHAIVIDSARGAYWAALSSEHLQFAGLFRSDDEGATWQPVPGLKQKQVWALASWPVDAHVMAAGTEDGVFITRDGGTNWTPAQVQGGISPYPVVSLAFHPADVNTLYAGTPHLAWKTTDGGASWRPLSKGMQEDSDIFSFDVDVRWPSHLFIGACSGIYRSLDGGKTWSSLEHSTGGQIRTYVITSPPDRPKMLYAGTTLGLMVSPDEGASWYKLLSTTTRSIVFDPYNPHRVLLATDDGVASVDDSTARVGIAMRRADKRLMR